MFSAQAQVDCCFQLSNPSADTLTGIANMPNGLPLTHTMTTPNRRGFVSNIDLMFSNDNCLGIDYDTSKVSIELELWCDGQNIVEDPDVLSRYCDITLQTFYNELHWLGTPMDGHNYPFAYEYPGAVPIYPGTYQISNIAFDYFYFKFLVNTRTRLQINWKQAVRHVMLVVHIRERLHGTNNELYWDGQQRENLGGHQSHPGIILASDTLDNDPIVELNDTIKDCEPVPVGMPAYTMDTTGTYVIAYVDTSCGYRIDSIVTYDYTHYVHPTTPTLSDSTIRYCQKGDATPLTLPAEPNSALVDHVADIVPYWYFAAEDSFYYAATFTPKTDTVAGNYLYFVKRHDNVTSCESEIDTFIVTINPNPATPVVNDTLVEYCVGETAVALSYPAPAGQQVLWGTSSDDITSTVAPVPTTTAAGRTIYYLKLQDTTTVNRCVSEGYDSIAVAVYANPTVAITIDNDTLCYGEKASMSAAPTTWTTYQWQQDGVDVTDSTNTTFSYTNNVADTTTFKFSVVVSDLHVVKSCTAKDSVSVLAYPEMGAPTVTFTDTTVCGPTEVTFEATPGAHASSANWYDAAYQLLAADTVKYTATFEKTDTIYVSSINDYGCETPQTQWVRIIVTVDTIPAITLKQYDTVCAGVDLMIYSSVVSSYTPVTYAWTGTGLVAPLDEDSVRFNYTIAGDYTDTLTVRDIKNCFNTATIQIHVDSLPVIALGVNYTIQNDSYCVGHNGEIIFTTPEYVRYSINNGTTWQDTAKFLNLPFDEYQLLVEDANGCKNNPAVIDSVKDARAHIVPVLTMTPNTYCDITKFDGTIAVTSVTPASESYKYYYIKGANTSAQQLDTLFEGLEHGFYTVFAVDTITGCQGSDTITVGLTQEPAHGSVTAAREICFEKNNNVIFTPGDTSVVFDYWTWTYSDTTKVLDPTVYKDTFDIYGFTAGIHGFEAHFHDTITKCTGSFRDTVRVIGVNISLEVSPNATVCEFDTVTVYCKYEPLEGYPGDPVDHLVLYQWTARYYEYAGGVDTIKVSPSHQKNKVSIIVEDNHGCRTTTERSLSVRALPTVSATGPRIYCDGATTDLTAYYNSSYIYRWIMESDTISYNHHFNKVLGNRDTTVVLRVKDDLNCVNDSTFSIHMVHVPGAPVFTPDTQYFCDNAVTVDTTAQNTPKIGTFTWLTESPNVAKISGTYAAQYVNTESGVSCYSANDTVVVKVTGAPVFTTAIRYNSETAIDTTHVRCVAPGAGDTLHISVNPAASATLSYSYKLNGVDSAANMIITRTEPGIYVDTIYIKATATHPTTTCEKDTTIYYTLRVNALPTAPTNFPNSYNGGDSTIFYCQGGAAVYDFTTGLAANQIVTYNGSTTVPTSAATGIALKVTDTMTHCSNTFYYDIVEVPTPTVKLTSTLADDCSDTLRGKVIATVTPAYDATFERVYTWTPATVDPASPHSRYENTDTVTYTFRAPNDTIVTAHVTINAVSGPEASYSAFCVSADSSFIVTFQPAPDKPELKDTFTWYADIDSAAYCAGEAISISATDFTTSTGATVSIVGYTTITTAGVYKVVANNTAAPYCPSDTLTFTVHEKRTPVLPLTDSVFYCANTTPSYTFTKVHADDTISYYKGTVLLPSQLLPSQPDTAGTFFMHVVDKLEGCPKDTTFVIVEIPNPTATLVSVTNWNNDSICEGTTINRTYTFNITPNVVRAAKETFTWKDLSSTTNTATLNTVPTADTSVTFLYHLVDTFSNAVSTIACAYNFDTTVHYTFFHTPVINTLVSDTAFCAGDSIVVIDNDFFSLGAYGDTIVAPDTTVFKAATGTVVGYAAYKSFLSCKSADATINVVRNELPTVDIINPVANDTTICKGDTALLVVTGAVDYLWSTGSDNDTIPAIDSIKYYVTGTDANGCKNVDSVKVNFHPLFDIVLSNDTTVCIDSAAVITATVNGPSTSYTMTWYQDNSTTPLYPAVSGASPLSDTHTVTPPTSAIVDGKPVPTLYKVEVEDAYGCSLESKNIKVAVTDRAQFEFYTIGGTDQLDHYIEVTSNNQSGFDMIIRKNCWDENELVFVDVQVYGPDGNPMTDAQLGEVMDFYTANYNFNYDFELTPANAPSVYGLAMHDNNALGASHYFPYSRLISSSPEHYSWFYMHFLSERRITVRTGAWKNGAQGKYTMSFAVIRTTFANNAAEIGIPYMGAKLIGGNGGHYNLVKDTIALDVFTFYVDTTYAGYANDNFDNTPSTPAVITPAIDEDNVAEALNMNVYPNPASNNVNVVLSGVKGQTVLTVHDMSGKVVNNMRVDIDDNNQIINIPVSDYSQGIYFIKVVNGSAVMTKKLIIAR